MAIRRENIFSKTLTDTDVKFRLAIPTESLGHFGQISEGNNSIDFEALDSEGHPWPFCLSTRRGGPYLKPVLKGKGWCAFVRAKYLRENDIVTFFKETDENNVMRFRIQAKKTIRLFGKDIKADV